MPSMMAERWKLGIYLFNRLFTEEYSFLHNEHVKPVIAWLREQKKKKHLLLEINVERPVIIRLAISIRRDISNY